MLTIVERLLNVGYSKIVQCTEVVEEEETKKK
jgi:hypothetical protein